MQHADTLIQRILFLEGMPNLQNVAPLRIGENIKEVLECDLEGEKEALASYNQSRIICHEEGDFVSMAIFDKLLAEEEAHLDFLETQLNMIEKMGIENYSLLNSEPANDKSS